jgi:hypothetical protein
VRSSCRWCVIIAAKSGFHGATFRNDSAEAQLIAASSFCSSETLPFATWIQEDASLSSVNHSCAALTDRPDSPQLRVFFVISSTLALTGRPPVRFDVKRLYAATSGVKPAASLKGPTTEVALQGEHDPCSINRLMW